MPTVSKQIADEIVQKDGHYADDPRVYRIVEYTNAWGGKGYGLEYESNIGNYQESYYIRDPRVYWSAT